jgi:hypothetical protein
MGVLSRNNSHTIVQDYAQCKVEIVAYCWVHRRWVAGLETSTTLRQQKRQSSPILRHTRPLSSKQQIDSDRISCRLLYKWNLRKSKSAERGSRESCWFHTCTKMATFESIESPPKHSTNMQQEGAFQRHRCDNSYYLRCYLPSLAIDLEYSFNATANAPFFSKGYFDSHFLLLENHPNGSIT